jgi:chaperonin GroES
MKILPTKGNVIIKAIEQKQTGSYIIPDSAKEKPQIGEVIASSVKEFKKGDKVVYKKWGGSEVKIEDKEYIIVDRKDILAIL